jgi:hypothetical protein
MSMYAPSAPHTPGIVPVNRSLRIYIYTISSLFWLGLFAALMTGALGSLHLQQLAPLFGLAIAVEAIGVRKQDNTIGFSAVAHLAAAVLFGPVAAASIAALAVVLVDGIRSRRTHFILLNSAMFGTAAWTAGLAYEATGGTVGTVVPSNVLPLVALVATRLLVNEAIFSGASRQPARLVRPEHRRGLPGRAVGLWLQPRALGDAAVPGAAAGRAL